MLFDVKLAKSISSLLSSIVLSISSLLCVFGDISVYWGNNNCMFLNQACNPQNYHSQFLC